MREFIEGQQFRYVNDSLKFDKLKINADEYSINNITTKLKEVERDVRPAIDFLSKSIDRIDKDIDKWYSGYLKKIAHLNSTSLFIQMKNISTSSQGTYALFEFKDTDSNSVTYDPIRDGYTMPSLDEKYTLKV